MNPFEYARGAVSTDRKHSLTVWFILEFKERKEGENRMIDMNTGEYTKPNAYTLKTKKGRPFLSVSLSF